MVHATNEQPSLPGVPTPKPPPAKMWQASEPPFNGYKASEPDAFGKSDADTAIVIDNGISSPCPVLI